MNSELVSVLWSLLKLAAVGNLIFFIIKQFLWYRKYPPGPWGFPIVGHLPLLGDQPWKTLGQWTKHYGPIIAVRFGSYHVVSINDVKLMKEIFNQTAVSGRPQLKCFTPSEGKGLAFCDGPLVREQRQFVLRQMKNFANDSNMIELAVHEEIQEVIQILRSQSGQAIKNSGHIYPIPTINVTWSLFMGQRFEHSDPKLQQLCRSVSDYLSLDGILANLAAFIPWISTILPNASGHISQNAAGYALYNFIQDGFEAPLPDSYVPGQPRNFKEAFIDEMERNKDNPNSSFHQSHNIFSRIIGDVFIGAAETISKTLDWFQIYMASHPQIQKKLYNEIIEVIGTSRLPSLRDRPNLNYAEAVVSESLRFSSVAPIGMFRRCLEDVHFHGYKLPKDTLVMGNIYGINFEPTIWGDPDVFRPERFLDASGKHVRSENLVSFSVGKRSCIGQNLGLDQLFLYMTTIVQTFEISFDPKKVPSLEPIPAFVLGPKPHELIFTER